MIRVHGGADCIRVAQIPKRSPNLANHSVPTHRFRDTWSRGTSPPLPPRGGEPGYVCTRKEISKISGEYKGRRVTSNTNATRI